PGKSNSALFISAGFPACATPFGFTSPWSSTHPTITPALWPSPEKAAHEPRASDRQTSEITSRPRRMDFVAVLLEKAALPRRIAALHPREGLMPNSRTTRRRRWGPVAPNRRCASKVGAGPCSAKGPTRCRTRLPLWKNRGGHPPLGVPLGGRKRLRVGVHRDLDVGMSEQLLHRLDVLPVRLQQSRIGVTERVPADPLVDAGPFGGRLKVAFQDHAGLHRF